MFASEELPRISPAYGTSSASNRLAATAPRTRSHGDRVLSQFRGEEMDYETSDFRVGRGRCYRPFHDPDFRPGCPFADDHRRGCRCPDGRASQSVSRAWWLRHTAAPWTPPPSGLSLRRVPLRASVAHVWTSGRDLPVSRPSAHRPPASVPQAPARLRTRLRVRWFLQLLLSRKRLGVLVQFLIDANSRSEAWAVSRSPAFLESRASFLAAFVRRKWYIPFSDSALY